MPKELTRVQKLEKYNVPKTIEVAKITIMNADDSHNPDLILEKIQIFEYNYSHCPIRKLVMEREEDYYDIYYNLVFIASRYLTEAEQDALIAKGDEEEAKKNVSFKKAKATYIKELKKKYPNYKLPSPPSPEELDDLNATSND